jgi:hypothetical protein
MAFALARFYGIYVAGLEAGASLSPSYMRETASGGTVGMMKLLREIMVVGLLAVVSVSAFAQRRDQDKRPPKEGGKVVTQDKQRNSPPPPQNSNRPKPDDKKKP